MNKFSAENKAARLIDERTAKADPACWQKIGIWGDRTCPKLSTISHCHHCIVYRTAGAKLLNRPISSESLMAQTARVAEPEPVKQEHVCPALIFRLETEWLALPAELCQQILSPLAAHTLPHRSNSTLLGIVNVRGQLLLKISLLPVLGMGRKGEEEREREGEKKYSRMVVVSKTLESGIPDTWAFDVDEMYGIQSVPFDNLQAAAAGVTSATDTCTRYVFDWQSKRVSFLDNIKLFELVRRQAL